MNSDTFFTGTKTHKVCEDYCRSGQFRWETSNLSYAILSDGCSSSPDTDVGARLLTLATLKTLPFTAIALNSGLDGRFLQPSKILDYAVAMLDHTLDPDRRPDAPAACTLNLHCLDATLLVACEVPTGVMVSVSGDGFVLARRHDGAAMVHEFDCGGAPTYLSYLWEPERKAAYHVQFGGKRTITVRKHTFDPLTSMVVSVHNEWPFLGKADYAGEASPFYTFHLPKTTYDLVLLCSDGIKSFQTPDFQTVPVEEVLPHLLSFKSFAGEFVTRRMQSFLKYTDWQHNDDLGVAGIYLGGAT